jgi:hypothetical protein
MAHPRPVVFVVDDDASVRKRLARLVKIVCYEVEAFASVGEFLARPPTTVRPVCFWTSACPGGPCPTCKRHSGRWADRSRRCPDARAHQDVGAAGYLSSP